MRQLQPADIRRNASVAAWHVDGRLRGHDDGMGYWLKP
jgi:hypothetical protein